MASTIPLLFIFLFLALPSQASPELPLYIDIRDITTGHLRPLGPPAQTTRTPKNTDYLEFNCELLSGKKQTFCLLNNEFLYDNHNSYPRRQDRLIDFRPFSRQEDLYYDLHGANKYWQIQDSRPATLSIQLTNVAPDFSSVDLYALIYFGDSVFVHTFQVDISNNNFFTRSQQPPVLLQEPMQLNAQVGLLDTMMVLSVETQEVAFQKAYPVSVPGFNYLENSLKAIPLNRTYYLSNSNQLSELSNNRSLRERKYPKYYDGLPFIKILNSDNKYFSYGFHNTLNSSPLNRGFLSAGCYRMRPKDIIEFYHIFKNLTHSYGTTQTTKNAPTGFYHPHPKAETFFSKEKYVDGKKGEKGITEMELVYLNVDEKLPLDNLKSYFDYFDSL